MGSVLNNASLIHDDDSIGMTHRAEAMGNNQCGSVNGDVHQGPLDRRFSVVELLASDSFFLNWMRKLSLGPDSSTFYFCGCTAEGVALHAIFIHCSTVSLVVWKRTKLE